MALFLFALHFALASGWLIYWLCVREKPVEGFYESEPIKAEGCTFSESYNSIYLDAAMSAPKCDYRALQAQQKPWEGQAQSQFGRQAALQTLNGILYQQAQIQRKRPETLLEGLLGVVGNGFGGAVVRRLLCWLVGHNWADRAFERFKAGDFLLIRHGEAMAQQPGELCHETVCARCGAQGGNYIHDTADIGRLGARWQRERI